MKESVMRFTSKITATVLLLLVGLCGARVAEAGGHVVRPAWILEVKITHCGPWQA
jgi:hypothetical protein